MRRLPPLLPPPPFQALFFQSASVLIPNLRAQPVVAWTLAARKRVQRMRKQSEESDSPEVIAGQITPRRRVGVSGLFHEIMKSVTLNYVSDF